MAELPDLRIDRWVVPVRSWHDAVKLSGSNAVESGEERHVDPRSVAPARTMTLSTLFPGGPMEKSSRWPAAMDAPDC
jgi:hypothetical protein